MYDKADLIIRQVSLQTGVPLSDLTTKGKRKHVAAAKRICRRRLREEAGLSWGEINLFLGYRCGNNRL